MLDLRDTEHPFQVVYFAVYLSEIPSAPRLLLLIKNQERSEKFPGRFFCPDLWETL